MAQQVLAILDDPRFAELFAPGSRAEVPIVGRIARAGATRSPSPARSTGSSVTGDTVLIADYKTDRLVPRPARRRAARLRHASSRSTARCWRSVYPGKDRARRAASGPMGPI